MAADGSNAFGTVRECDFRSVPDCPGHVQLNKLLIFTIKRRKQLPRQQVIDVLRFWLFKIITTVYLQFLKKIS